MIVSEALALLYSACNSSAGNNTSVCALQQNCCFMQHEAVVTFIIFRPPSMISPAATCAAMHGL